MKLKTLYIKINIKSKKGNNRMVVPSNERINLNSMFKFLDLFRTGQLKTPSIKSDKNILLRNHYNHAFSSMRYTYLCA